MNLLKEADFSRETDLKERLYQKLFERKEKPFSKRVALSDDETEMVSAAGNPQAVRPGREEEKNSLNNLLKR